MIGTSVASYVLVRLSIFGLRLITPLSLVGCLFVVPPLLGRRPDRSYVLWTLELWMAAESGFYLCVFLPLQWLLQREAAHAEPLPAARRRELFRRCTETIVDPDAYLKTWFLHCPPADIRRDNVREFLAWAMLSKRLEAVAGPEQDELDLYVSQLEARLGRPIPSGRGNATALRQTFDQVIMWHRPLLWYLIILAVELYTSVRLARSGWRFYRTPLAHSITNFPPRLFSVFSKGRSPAKTVSYWHRPLSKAAASSGRPKKLPVLFIHGIGIGLYPYVDFLNYVAKGIPGVLEDQAGSGSEEEEDAGYYDPEIEIIAVEIMPISARICSPALSAEVLREEIESIVNRHGWTEFVLVGNSFGTAVSANLLKDPVFAPRVKKLGLIDPICFLLHFPDVVYNFTRRPPRRANEYMLHYFASTDMMVAHTLARQFVWSEHVLWQEDLANVPTFVSLGALDLIVNCTAVWDYLSQPPPLSPIAQCERDSIPSKGFGARDEARWGTMEVWKFSKLDHAQVFDKPSPNKAVALRIRDMAIDR